MQKKQWLGSLGWVIIVVVAFWGGWLTAPEKIKVEKTPETIVYKIDEIPLNAISAYLGVMGYEVNPRDWAEKIRADEHITYQSGYKAGYEAGYRDWPRKR